MADLLISTGMKNVGYNHVNVDGGWQWIIDNTEYILPDPGVTAIQRNDTGYILPDPVKFPDGILTPINYIKSLGLKYGHYTCGGVKNCGGALNSSQNWMSQDISLFANEWKIDMIKVDDCFVEGNDTQLIFKWRDMLNATGRPIVFSNCRNGCQVDDHTLVLWQPYCVNLSNTWRVSWDIYPQWTSILHNFDQNKGLGKFNQPGAWSDLDFLEIDIGEFNYSEKQNPSERILIMNQAHFSLWCIVSAPLIAGNDLRNMKKEILDILTNKYAIEVNQNYLNNGGDVITEFNITGKFRNEYLNECSKNNNMTQLFYKPLPSAIGDAALVFLNRNTTDNYSMVLEFNQLPLTNDHNNTLQCNVYDIWNESMSVASKVEYYLPRTSVKFIKLSNCSTIVRMRL
eukprot:351297_1